MKRSPPILHRKLRYSAGVGLITAIFLLVVLAGLGVAMVTIFNAQQASSSLDVQGARAYQAAKAGIEWGLFQQLRNNTCDPVKSFALPDGSSLSSFVVTVKCARIPGPQPEVGDPQALDRWMIEATACNLQPSDGSCPNHSNSPDYVQRRIEVRI
jgi:MSHA biogenesis protein MshP